MMQGKKDAGRVGAEEPLDNVSPIWRRLEALGCHLHDESYDPFEIAYCNGVVDKALASIPEKQGIHILDTLLKIKKKIPYVE